MKTQPGDAWFEALSDPRSRLTIPLFAHQTVAPGWASSQPGLAEHLIYLVVRERGLGAVAGRAVELRPGSALWVPPRVPFHFKLARATSPIELYRLRLALVPGVRPKTALVPPFPGLFLLISEAMELRPLFESILLELQTRGTHHAHHLRGLLLAFTTGLVRLGEGKALARSGLSPAACAAIQARAGGADSSADLAAGLGYAPAYFTRLFRKTYGMPPRAWLVRERLRLAAQELLDSPVSIGDLAERAGYGDLFQFSRQFKRVHGMSPSAWRRAHGLREKN